MSRWRNQTFLTISNIAKEAKRREEIQIIQNIRKALTRD